ncbi:MAG: hypothetical protein WCF18_12560, partial [Chthoniobacteraceae bacterium]
MTTPPPPVLPICNTVGTAVAHFKKLKTEGTQVRLTAVLNCNKTRVRNYFYKHCCKVSITEVTNSDRVITFNGFNTSGKAVTREAQAVAAKSKRPDTDPILPELFDEDFKVGDTIFTRGIRSNITRWLYKKYGAGKVLI